MSVFAGTNTLRGSYTRRSLDNNFWNVDTPLNHLRKQQQLVKRPISPGQHFPIKLAGPSVPMSAPGGFGKHGESKVPQFAFPLWGKEKHACWSISGDEERHAARAGATMDPELNGDESTWKDLTLSSHRAHCAEKKTSLHRGHSQPAPLTLAWLSKAPTCQSKQQPRSCQPWNSTSFQAIIVKEKLCMSTFSARGEAATGEVHLPQRLSERRKVLVITAIFNQQCVQNKVLHSGSI